MPRHYTREFWALDEVSIQLGAPVEQVSDWAERGMFPQSLKIGDVWLIRRNDIRNFAIYGEQIVPVADADPPPPPPLVTGILCRVCRTTWPASEFSNYKGRGGKLRDMCRDCSSEYYRTKRKRPSLIPPEPLPAAFSQPRPAAEPGAGGPGYVYFICSGGLCKIGLSRRPLSRFVHVTDKFAQPSHLIQVLRTKNMAHAERYLHRVYGTARRYKEWFALSEAQLIEIMTLRDIDPLI